MTNVKKKMANDLMDQFQEDLDRMKDHIERLFIGRSVLLEALWRYIDAQERARFEPTTQAEKDALKELRRHVQHYRRENPDPGDE
jgi:hypothetical protein